MNPKVWVLELECGHDVYHSAPLKKSYVCDKCGGKAQPATAPQVESK